VVVAAATRPRRDSTTRSDTNVIIIVIISILFFFSPRDKLSIATIRQECLIDCPKGKVVLSTKAKTL
jgi:hypothetical protein